MRSAIFSLIFLLLLSTAGAEETGYLNIDADDTQTYIMQSFIHPDGDYYEMHNSTPSQDISEYIRIYEGDQFTVKYLNTTTEYSEQYKRKYAYAHWELSKGDASVFGFNYLQSIDGYFPISHFFTSIDMNNTVVINAKNVIFNNDTLTVIGQYDIERIVQNYERTYDLTTGWLVSSYYNETVFKRSTNTTEYTEYYFEIYTGEKPDNGLASLHFGWYIIPVLVIARKKRGNFSRNA